MQWGQTVQPEESLEIITFVQIDGYFLAQR